MERELISWNAGSSLYTINSVSIASIQNSAEWYWPARGGEWQHFSLYDYWAPFHKMLVGGAGFFIFACKT